MRKNHAVNLEKTYSSGAQLWRCPTCGRLVIWQFPPMKMKNIVLADGDSSVSHSGSCMPGLNFFGVNLQGETDDDQFPSDLRSEINDILTELEDGFDDILGSLK